MFRIFLPILLLTVFLSGCATTARKSDSDQLQNRVVDLEKKLEEKDSEIVDLQYEIKDLHSKLDTKSVSAAPEIVPDEVVVTKGGNDIIRVNVPPQSVQTALKKAGYYTGKVDGKVGAGTKAAIVAFQKSQGLTADGILGRKTWDALKQHLNE